MSFPPSKRWRVYGARGISKDFKSQRGAYEHVRTILAAGVPAKVYLWEHNGWQLYEKLEPEPDNSGSAQISRIVEEENLPN